MSVKLSEYHINSLIKKLRSIDRTLNYNQYNIIGELVDKGVKRGTILNNQATRSGLVDSVVIPRKPMTEKDGVIRGKVILKGPHAIFEEFGSGEVGKSDPHPQSGTLSFLVPPEYSGYITGSFVRTHINKYGRHYWFYRPMAGMNDYFQSNGYTEGIPSGKQMYNTAKYLNQIKHKVAAKHLKPAIKEINKSINDFE